VVCLGATAAKTLLGASFKVTLLASNSFSRSRRTKTSARDGSRL
jgi:hypothetical protein